jgi:hypothetical protein
MTTILRSTLFGAVSLGLSTSLALGAPACPDVLARVLGTDAQPELSLDDWKKVDFELQLQEGKSYRLFQESSEGLGLVKRQLKFEGVVVNGDRATYRFKSRDGKIIEIEGAPSRIRQGAKLDAAIHTDSAPSKLIPLLELAFGIQFASQKFARLIFTPYQTRWKSAGIRIVGGRRIGQEKVNQMGEALVSFDKKLRSLNLAPPQDSRIVISDGKLPDFTGPCYVNAPLLSIWNGRCYPTIDMPRVLNSTVSFEDYSILLHERVHSVLHHSFDPESVSAASSSYQETFADILATHVMGRPQVGKDFPVPGASIRDLSVPPKGPVYLKATAAEHDNSEHLSSVLWNLRADFMKADTSGESFEQFIGSLLRRLDQHDRALVDYQAAIRKKSGADLEVGQEFVGEYLYAMIHIENELKARGMESSWLRIRAEPSVARNLDYLKDSHEALRKSVLATAPVIRGTARVGKGKGGTAILVNALPAGLLVEGYIVYKIFDDK